MSHANNALKCFDENLKMFGHAQSQPEKYNLYNGLGNLARSMKEMQAEIHSLRQEVNYLRQKS